MSLNNDIGMVDFAVDDRQFLDEVINDAVDWSMVR